jgi:hypothetical protein
MITMVKVPVAVLRFKILAVETLELKDFIAFLKLLVGLKMSLPLFPGVSTLDSNGPLRVKATGLLTSHPTRNGTPLLLASEPLEPRPLSPTLQPRATVEVPNLLGELPRKLKLRLNPASKLPPESLELLKAP